MNDKVHIIKQFEKMYETLLELAEFSNTHFKSDAEQEATRKAIQALTDMVLRKEYEIAGSEDELLDLLMEARKVEAK